MSLPEIVTRDEWLAARRRLLAREKELTRQRDELNADRRRLPMVRIDKDYVFEGAGGEARLPDLFEGRRQLIVQHFMFDPSWEDGCSSCYGRRRRALAAACWSTWTPVTRPSPQSRGRPSPSSNAYRRARGWTFPWYSSLRQRLQLRLPRHRGRVGGADGGQLPRPRRAGEGLAGAAQPDRVRAAVRAARASAASCAKATTCSTPTRRSAAAPRPSAAPTAYLDLTALGRQEEWEEPKGRVESPHGAVPDFAT